MRWAKFNRAEREVYLKYKYRGLKLSFEEFIHLTKQNCYYCGSLPSNLRKARGDSFLYNGLDKMNPKGGYILANVVPSCWRCNKMKSNLTHDQFLAHIRQILVKLSNEKS